VPFLVEFRRDDEVATIHLLEGHDCTPWGCEDHSAYVLVTRDGVILQSTDLDGVYSLADLDEICSGHDASHVIGLVYDMIKG